MVTKIKSAYFTVPARIFKCNLKPNELAVLLLFLKMRSNNFDTCYPSVSYIAEMCNMSRSSIIRATNNLCSLGFIEKHRDIRFKDGKNVIGGTNVYSLNMEQIERANMSFSEKLKEYYADRKEGKNPVFPTLETEKNQKNDAQTDGGVVSN